MDSSIIEIRSPKNLLGGWEHAVLAVTGNPGSGKSTVSAICRDMGATVLDADRLGHRMLRVGSPVFAHIVEVFGEDILNEEGDIDRNKLGQIVFQSPENLPRLNRIVHPPMLDALQAEIASYRASETQAPLLVDAALIYEWSIEDWFDLVVVVTAAPQTRRDRYRKKSDDRTFTKREAAQLPESYKLERADVIIHNDTSLKQLRTELTDFVKSVKRKNINHGIKNAE